MIHRKKATFLGVLLSKKNIAAPKRHGHRPQHEHQRHHPECAVVESNKPIDEQEESDAQHDDPREHPRAGRKTRIWLGLGYTKAFFQIR